LPFPSPSSAVLNETLPRTKAGPSALKGVLDDKEHDTA